MKTVSSNSDRQERGRAIAATPGAVTREGSRFAVTIRSVDDNGPALTFYVRRTEGGPRCTCPDFKRRSVPHFNCEHIYAVVFYLDGQRSAAEAARITEEQA